jgi:CRISP-associated protein Cas1
MKKTYYLFNPGRMSRQDNTLKYTPVSEDGEIEKARFLPIETISDLYIFGSLDTNSSLYNFLGKQSIPVHFFDYYEHYTGSFMPKEYLLAGKMQIEQTKTYIALKKRLPLAKAFVDGAAMNILKNLQYYQRRGKDVSATIEQILNLRNTIENAKEIDELMGTEGNIRKTYYAAFDTILNDFEIGNRTKQPPTNEVNSLVSFGNMMCYSVCLSQIYHTQLNPTISFLHEPGYRRFSLALDLAEIFKPLLVDRVIFTVLNRKQITSKDFVMEANKCILKDSARKTFVKAFEDKLTETIEHRTLGKHVSYKHLVKLECYKLTKHILGIENYVPFKAWW